MKLKPQSDEYRAFENVLSKVLAVTKAALDKRLKEEKQEKKIPTSRVRADKPAHC